MSLAKLSIDLEARLAGLQAGLDKAGLLAERSAARIESTFAGMGSAFKVLSGTLAAGLSIAGITTFIRSTAAGLDKLNDLKDATGASVENLSALEDIAVRTGTSMDTAGDAVIKLNKALNTAADPKSDAAAALNALGLSVKDLQALDPVEALLKVGTALNGFADNGAKGRIELVLLGKGTKELAPLLKDLAEAGKLNATVTKEQAEEAERFNKTLFAMEKNSIDVARAISGPLITALADMFEKLNKARQERKTWAGLLGLPEESAAGLDAELQRKAERIDTLNKLLETGNLSADRRLRIERQLTNLQATPAIPVAGGFANTAASFGGGKPSLNDLPSPSSGKPKQSRDISLGSSPISESLRDALSAIDQADTVKIAKLNAALDELFSMRANGLGGGAELDEAVKKLRDELEKLDPAAQAAAEAKKRLDAILAKTPTGELQLATQDIDLLNAAFERGKISAEHWAEGVLTATDALRKGNDETKAAIDEMTVFSEQAARNIQDALGNTIEASLSGRFDSIGALWKNLLIRMASEGAAAQIGKGMFGDFGKSGEMGGLFGEFLKFLKPGAGNIPVSAAPPTAFAAGGILGPLGGLLTRPTIFPMANGGVGIGGEAGIEAVMPLKRGANGKLGVAAQGGGGIGKVVVNNYSGQPAKQERSGPGGRDLIVTIGEIAAAEVDRRLSSGGSTARALQRTFGASRLAGAPRRG